MALMHPRPEKTFVVKPEMMNQLKLYEAPPKPAKFASPSDWMNWWPGFNVIVFIGGLIWLELALLDQRGGVDAQRRQFCDADAGYPFSLATVVLPESHGRKQAKAVWGIVIQFPFYAGIFGSSSSPTFP